MKSFLYCFRVFVFVIPFTLGQFAVAEEFVEVYKDKFNGLSWGQVLGPKYSNRSARWPCSSSRLRPHGDKDESSEAMAACLKIGARLPTARETISLIRNFPYKEVDYRAMPQLTEKGYRQMSAIFKDLDTSFWTASDVCGGWIGYSIYFQVLPRQLSLANIFMEVETYSRHSARCVRDDVNIRLGR